MRGPLSAIVAARQISRKLLREAHDVTFEQWQKLAFDTTLVLAADRAARLQGGARDRSKQSRIPSWPRRSTPTSSTCCDWDCRVTADVHAGRCCAPSGTPTCTATAIRPKTLKPQFVESMPNGSCALVEAAKKLKSLHGDWKVAWGKVTRTQRVPNATSVEAAGQLFRDQKPSLPLVGAPGPLGVAFTLYYTPSIPLRKQRFGVVGGSFMGVYEFGPRVKSATVLQYGESGDPKSPHYFDQAKLYSDTQIQDRPGSTRTKSTRTRR